MEKVLELIESITRLLTIDPLAAADKIDQVADLLKMYARGVRREVASQGHAPTSPGGLGDSCRMQVAGPDGIVKQNTTARG